jgi:hypothetical protein
MAPSPRLLNVASSFKPHNWGRSGTFLTGLLILGVQRGGRERRRKAEDRKAEQTYTGRECVARCPRIVRELGELEKGLPIEPEWSKITIIWLGMDRPLTNPRFAGHDKSFHVLVGVFLYRNPLDLIERDFVASTGRTL